jgi:predicted Zn-dependent protease
MFVVSRLDEQNRLFMAAMDARRTGNPQQALLLLQQLIAEHPDSPLLGQAQRERDAIAQNREAEHP